MNNNIFSLLSLSPLTDLVVRGTNVIAVSALNSGLWGSHLLTAKMGLWKKLLPWQAKD